MSMSQHYWELIGAIGAGVATTVIGPTIFEFIKHRFIDKYIGKKKVNDPDPIKENLKEHMIIDDDLSDLREKATADRVWIMQFHNGGHFLQFHKSLQKFSITHEDCSPGVSSVSFLLKEIPISLYTKTLTEILENGFIYIPDFGDNNVHFSSLKSTSIAAGTKTTFMVGLFDIETNKCIGVLGVDFLEETEITGDQRDIIIERAGRLAGYLTIHLKSY